MVKSGVVRLGFGSPLALRGAAASHIVRAGCYPSEMFGFTRPGSISLYVSGGKEGVTCGVVFFWGELWTQRSQLSPQDNIRQGKQVCVFATMAPLLGLKKSPYDPIYEEPNHLFTLPPPTCPSTLPHATHFHHLLHHHQQQPSPVLVSTLDHDVHKLSKTMG